MGLIVNWRKEAPLSLLALFERQEKREQKNIGTINRPQRHEGFGSR